MSDRPTPPEVSDAAKLTLLGSLYFAQGLPFGFFTQALPVMMRKTGYSLGQIGLTSLLALPWALKFLWAPAVDRCWSARLGRRRCWILPLQGLAVVILCVLGLSGGAQSLRVVMAATLLLNLVAASQDIATDGLAVDIVAPAQRGIANGLQVAGYRIGMIAGGGALLVFYDRLGARLTFLAMAALTALSTIPVARLREPPPAAALERRFGAASSRSFFRRAGTWRLLALVMTYKAGEAFATGMLRPFLADLGLGLSDVGLLIGTVGFVAGMAGALTGGALVARLGRRPALLVFGALQAAAVASYAFLAFHASHAHPSRSLLFAVCGLEHLAGGMATAALFTCMMDWCAPETSATDYTIQASAVVVATGLAATAAGASAQAFGYLRHFGLATGLALGALLVVARNFPEAESAPDAAPGAPRKRTVPTCA